MAEWAPEPGRAVTPRCYAVLTLDPPPERERALGILSVAINGLVVAAAGIGLAWLVNGRFGDLSARIRRFAVRGDKRLGGFPSSPAPIRAEPTRVPLCVGGPHH